MYIIHKLIINYCVSDGSSTHQQQSSEGDDATYMGV